MLDPRNHQRVLIVVGMFGMKGEELLLGYQRELLVSMAERGLN